MEAPALKQQIEQVIPGACATIEDRRGDGAVPFVIVEAAAFRGQTVIEQHRMVHQALHKIMPLAELEDLLVSTRTPETLL